MAAGDDAERGKKQIEKDSKGRKQWFVK